MKKIIISVLIAVALMSCTVDPPAVDTPDLLPVLGFSSVTPRIVLPVETDVNKMMYFLMAPQVTSFSANSSNLGDGDSYTVDFLGSTVDVTISETGGLWVFNNSFENGWSKVEYNPVSKKFTYEQIVYIRDEHDILGGSGSDGTDKGTSIITWAKGSDIAISADGSFQGLVDFNVFGCNFMGETDGSNSLLYGKLELYRGVLDSSDIGTGYRTSMVNGVVNDSDLPAGRPAIGIIDTTKLSEYHTYLSTLDPATVSGNPIGSSIGYRYDDGRDTTNSQNTVSPYFLEQGIQGLSTLPDPNPNPADTRTLNNLTPDIWEAKSLITASNY